MKPRDSFLHPPNLLCCKKDVLGKARRISWVQPLVVFPIYGMILLKDAFLSCRTSLVLTSSPAAGDLSDLCRLGPVPLMSHKAFTTAPPPRPRECTSIIVSPCSAPGPVTRHGLWAPGSSSFLYPSTWHRAWHAVDTQQISLNELMSGWQ